MKILSVARRTLPLLAALAAVLALVGPTASAEATLISTPVSPGIFVHPGGGGVEYQSSSVLQFFDPAQTNWIAWDDLASPYACAPGTCIGSHGFGTDDFIRLMVTNPLGGSLEIDIDQNDGGGNSFGPQMIIYGTAANAPDVRRFDFFNGVFYFINEAGAFNSIFTTAGIYQFDFSFRDQFCCDAGHSGTFLLADVNPPAEVPEPGSLLLLATGVLGLAGLARRRRSMQGR